MGQRSSNPLVRTAASAAPITDDMRLVIGYLENDEFITTAPNWSKLGDVLDALEYKYGGLFLLHRDCLFCEWRTKESMWGNPGKHILLLPSSNDVVEKIYEAKQGAKAGTAVTAGTTATAYRNAIRNFGYQVGMPLIEIDV
jgi:hypothetical protein